MGVGIGQQRGERRVRRGHRVPEGLGDREARAVAAGLRYGEPARRHDDGSRARLGRAGQPDDPRSVFGHHVGHARPQPDPRPGLAHPVHEGVPNVTGPVALGKQLPGLLLQDQAHAELGLEEGALLGERPRQEHLPERVARRPRDVALGRRDGRKDVAAPTPADEDLPPAVGGALDEHDVDAATGGRERGEQARRAGSYDDDGVAQASAPALSRSRTARPLPCRRRRTS